MTRSSIVDAIVLVGGAGLVMWFSWHLGADACWDTLSYHLYTSHLALDHRWVRDIDAIGIEGFFNPIADVPFYLALIVWKVPPILIGLVTGALQAAGVWCVYKLVDLVWPGTWPWGTLVAIGAAVVAVFGATFYMEIGTHMNDSTLSALVLGALVILIAAIQDDGAPAMRALAIAGVLDGVAVGAKFVLITSLFGFAALILVLPGSFRTRITRLAGFGGAFLLGFLLADGYWLWQMYRHKGNALFPFFDQSWQSPMQQVIDVDAARFRPRSVSQRLFYPFFLATEQRLASESLIRDPRFAAAYLAVAAFLVTACARWRRAGAAWQSLSDRRIAALVAFVVASYLIWQMRSSYYRYAVPIEMVAGATVIACVTYVVRRWRWALGVTAPVCVFLVLFTKPADAGRLPWSSSHFGLDSRYVEAYGDATILLVDRPIGYVIPYFPASTSFIRIAKNLYLDGAATRDAIARRLQSVDRARVYLLDVTPGRDAEMKTSELDKLGLVVDDSRCQPFSTFVDSGRICLVRQVGQ